MQITPAHAKLRQTICRRFCTINNKTSFINTRDHGSAAISTYLSYDNGWLPHVVMSETHYTARLQFTQLVRAYVVVMLVCELTLLKLGSTVDCLWCEQTRSCWKFVAQHLTHRHLCWQILDTCYRSVVIFQ